MDSKTLTFLGLISGPRQYRIPPFQRAYSWEREERETLWLDMLTQYQRLHDFWHLDEEGREEQLQHVPSHYLGTIVLSGPSSLGVPRSDVIDGQQRITTLLLAVCALRDAWSKNLAKGGSARATEEAGRKRRSLTETYLKNAGQDGADQFRAIPLTIDKKAFEAVINFDGVGTFKTDSFAFAEGDSQRVIQAYKFFYTEMRRRAVNSASNPQLERFKHLFPLDFAILEQVVAHRLSVIAIETKSLDDTNAIFESLNAKGKPLSQLDLLRNYIFMLLRSKAAEVLSAYWEPMETVHLRPKEVELLVWADVVSRGTNVLQKRTYRTVQAQLRQKGASAAEAEAYVKELHRKSAYFKKILRPAEESHAGLQRALQRVTKAGGRTARPLLLWLYEEMYREHCDSSEAAQCVGLIESFLVRRFLAGLAPNNLNSHFGTMLARLNNEPGYAADTGAVVDRLQRVMLAAPREWPDDEALATGVVREDFYHNGDTGQRMLILESLDQSFGYQLPPGYIESDQSIEHILPQSKPSSWRADIKELGEDIAAVQERALHTLGNLTLVTPEVNSILGSKDFAQKRAIYAEVEYKLTQGILAYDPLTQGRLWGSEAISRRAADLSKRATSIWGRPVFESTAVSPVLTLEAADEFDELDDAPVPFSSSIEEESEGDESLEA